MGNYITEPITKDTRLKFVFEKESSRWIKKLIKWFFKFWK